MNEPPLPPNDPEHPQDDDSTRSIPPVSDDATQTTPSSPKKIAQRFRETQHPTRVGHYKILETLGEGGMGTVYLAEQTEPVHRKVALKLIKLGMDTKQVIARFDSERQALALMDHPNVAKMFDAGASEQGRPYFVMEYVRGIPITDYCDKHRLTTKERLTLFMQVCQAIQHAHQKGIIHRDIKPSNILVTVEDDTLVPKVIDFGVAKATQQKLTEQTLFTEQGQLIGTPEYMSPEQAEMTALDIDTRSDIYSLGVVLYELLVGALPFEPSSLRQAAFGEIQRIIREQEPPKPSTRLSSLGDESGTVAKKRHTTRAALEKQLHGDLDWITMKALEKDRTRRYATATEFAADIQRHLGNEPVLASPPGAAYRLRKFVRRNRMSVITAAVVFTSLTAGFSASLVFYIQADREAQKAIKVTKFLNEMITSIDPSKAKGREVTMREMLDEMSKRLNTVFVGEPEVEDTLRVTVATTYDNLGLYERSLPHIRHISEYRRKAYGLEDERTLAALDWLANNMSVTEPDALDKRAAIYEEIREAARRSLGKLHVLTILAMDHLGEVWLQQGRNKEGETLIFQALERAERAIGSSSEATAYILMSAANACESQERYREETKLRSRALQVMRNAHGDENVRTLNAAIGLSWDFIRKDRLAEAERLLTGTLATCRRSLGDSHPVSLETARCLVTVLRTEGKLDKARSLAAELIAHERKRVGKPDTSANDLNVYAWDLLTIEPADLRDPKAALPLARKAVEKSGGNDPGILDTLALAQQMTGDIDAAVETETEAVALLPPARSARRSGLESNLAKFLIEQESYAKSEPLLLALHQQMEDNPKSPDKAKQESVQRLIDLYIAWHTAEPDEGYDKKADDWRAKLTSLKAPPPPENGK